MRKSAKTRRPADEKSAMRIVVLGKTRGSRLRYAPAFLGILRKAVGRPDALDWMCRRFREDVGGLFGLAEIVGEVDQLVLCT